MDEMNAFAASLRAEEKSAATVKKYLRDVEAFLTFAAGRTLTKQLVLEYKQWLLEREYRPASINSMLASVNAWLRFTGREELRVRQLKLQRTIYCDMEKELTREEYAALVCTARAQNDERMALLLQTICATGIRVSELEFVTVEAVEKGYATVNCKGKLRKIFLVSELCQQLRRYLRRTNIREGPIFLCGTGGPMLRGDIWRRMKRLCLRAGVDPQKVYPHNLRHLFAREYYEGEHDLAKLADILGHSSINTTRIYIQSTGTEHRRQLEKMHLVL